MTKFTEAETPSWLRLWFQLVGLSAHGWVLGVGIVYLAHHLTWK